MMQNFPQLPRETLSGLLPTQQAADTSLPCRGPLCPGAQDGPFGIGGLSQRSCITGRCGTVGRKLEAADTGRHWPMKLTINAEALPLPEVLGDQRTRMCLSTWYLPALWVPPVPPLRRTFPGVGPGRQQNSPLLA